MDHKKLHSALLNLARKTTLSRVKAYCKSENLKLVDADDKNHPFEHSLVLILLSNAQMDVTLKFFFTPEKIQTLVQNTLENRFDQSKLAELARDVLKEVANLTMGHVKNRFIAANLKVESSLPIAMRGYDNLFFRDVDSSGHQEDYWSIEGEDFAIYCSLAISLSGEFKDINFEELTKEDDEPSGSIDFL